MTGNKPLYRIAITDGARTGYYRGESRWQIVGSDEAELLTHKEAERIRGKLKRLGYQPAVEKIDASVRPHTSDV